MNPIEKDTGPCVILAGAGTGKTHAIIEKAKHLVKNKIYNAGKIVCITFSNEAANSLQMRLQKALPSDEEVIVKTFHGFSSDLLRAYGNKINVNEHFRILDPNEAKIVIHTNLKVPAGNCNKYISAIGTAKDLGITIIDLQNYLEKEESKYPEVDLEKRLENLQFELQTMYMKKDSERKSILTKEIKEISSIIKLRKFTKTWNAYEKIKRIKHYLDYSDLNNKSLELLQKFPELGENYDYIIVDEFQDTNKVQLDILFGLAIKKNLCVVGDLNQSIYRFRGAYNKNFDEFKKHFNVKSEDIFNLDKSYRSPNKVLRAAHKLISNNYSNDEECFLVENAKNIEGNEIEIYELKDVKEEARKIVETIQNEIENGTQPEEICVMFRTHQYSRVVKQALEFAGIDYCAVTKASLLKQKSVKTIIDYLNILYKLKTKSRGGAQAWWDLIYQLDFNEKDLITIGKFIKDNRESENLSVLLLNELTKTGLSDAGEVSSKILIKRIKLMLGSLGKKVPELIKDVINFAGFQNGKTCEEKEIMLNLNRLYDLSENHSRIYESDLGSFVNYISVIQNLSINLEAARIEEKGVRLMTLHATKGLEYDTVIITNLSQKRFPMEKISNNPLIPISLTPQFRELELCENEMNSYLEEYERKHQIFDERRLCYVAFTRAKKKLILTYAQKYRDKECFPSQFLHEIDYIKNPDTKFSIDNSEKFELPDVEIKNSLDLEKNIHSKNFEENLQNELKNTNSKKSSAEIKFSPSALLLFSDCQKKYEYRYVFNMPEQKTIYWESMLLGSFVHKVLDEGVKSEFKEFKEFLNHAKALHAKEDWESVEFDNAVHLIKVFFERNKNKYSSKSKTEQKLDITIDGIKFTGFADRIDFNPDGLEIIDYKTGKSTIKPQHRNWQMGYYALAASELGKVKKITLDMLQQDKPLEFELDDDENAKEIYAGRMAFNVNEIKEEILSTAKKILEAYEKGFKPCSIEENCEFCNEWVHGL